MGNLRRVLMKRTLLGCLLALVVLPSPTLGTAQESPPSNVIVIDGKKNPEQIPEYRVWASTFRTFAESTPAQARKNYEEMMRDPTVNETTRKEFTALIEVIERTGRVLPDGLAEYVSAAETALIFAEADQQQKVQTDCVQRLIAAREPLSALDAGADQPTWFAKAKEVDVAMWEIELGCRRETLRMRDRVLEQLNVDGRNALVKFVESMKAGMKSFVPKNGLERYRLPQ